MNETPLHQVLQKVSRELFESGFACALVGGLAVSVRTEPRFTRDLDFAVAVSQDSEAEELVRFLTSNGYRATTLVEQEAAGRLATVRLLPPGKPSLIVDLLFASSGIEREIVAAAEPVEIITGITVRVATLPHLVAMKVLARDDARRPQDRIDLTALLDVATRDDLNAARQALLTIEARGFNRGKNLVNELDTLLASAEPRGHR